MVAIGRKDIYPTISAKSKALVHTVRFLLFERFQLLDVCGPLQVFATANDELRAVGKPDFYETTLWAQQTAAYPSSSGVPLAASRWPTRLSKSVGTVVVPGGQGAWSPIGAPPAAGSQAAVRWLAKNQGSISRMASVCTGAFILARTGLLDGRGAVTHWAACDALRQAAPGVDVQHDAIYYRDGPYWTSAGVTAGIDMALGMLESDLGREIAMDVAKKLVVFYKRPGGQSQFSSQLLQQSAGDERVSQLHEWMAKNLRSALTVTKLAERLAMSPRTFARFYVRATGVTPARAIEQTRLELACRMMEAQRPKLKAVAQQCGFTSEEVMRRTFIRHLHISPAEYRQRFSGR